MQLCGTSYGMSQTAAGTFALALSVILQERRSALVQLGAIPLQVEDCPPPAAATGLSLAVVPDDIF